MRARNRRAAAVGLVALTCSGVFLIATAERRTPPVRDGAGAAPRRFVTGIFDDPTAQNPWARYGPNGSTLNGYISTGTLPFLFEYSVGRQDWVPRLAEDVPSALVLDERSGLWRSNVRLRRGIVWSDGTPVTAHDVAFTFATIAELGDAKLGGNFPNYAPSEVIARVEARDEATVEFFLHRPDARFRYGALMAPIVQRRYWEPRVNTALASPDPIRAIASVDVADEPVAGPFLRGIWERGSFVDRAANRRYSFRGATDATFANGAVRVDDGRGGTWTGYGTPDEPPDVRVVSGPHVDTVHYKVFGSQAAAILALQSGEIDFIFNPNGLEQGLAAQLRGIAGVTIVENEVNGVRVMGFNLRREPMRRLAFRQAVATLVDREFVAERVLQGAAVPLASMVPRSNARWHNAQVPVYGQGMSRADRIREAVRLLEAEGFSWATRPEVSPDGQLTRQGSGLRMPDGAPMRPLELLSPTESYDALRSTFALWIERWLSEVGIPVRKRHVAFSVLQSRVVDQQDLDMWLMGHGLGNYPFHLQNMFHSRNVGFRGRNPSGFASPAFDRLADEFLAEADDLERARTLAFEIQDVLARAVPVIPLFNVRFTEAYRSDHVRFPTTQGMGGLQGSPRPGLIDSVGLEE